LIATSGSNGDADEGGQGATVLIANDQEWSARSLESLLVAEGYGIARAFTAAQAIKQAETVAPDVIILDRQMPDLDGSEVCRRLRQDPRIGAITPIIITTAGQAGRAQRAEAFEAGAWDFFGQPIDPEILLFKIRTFLAARKALESGGTEPLLDPLTGLYTRKGLDRRAREIIAEARRHNQPVACVVFSAMDPGLEAAVDRVDNLARRVAEFFRESGRAADAVGRLSHLEFGIIAPDTSAEGAARLMERLEQAMSDGKAEAQVRASYYVPDTLEDLQNEPEELIARAGAALKVSP